MQTLLIFIIAATFFYLLLYLLVPKKTNFYELVRIPPFLLRSLLSQRNNMIVEKHRYGKHRRQYFLFCQPKSRDSSKKHVIVYYHGGGWRSGSPELLRSNAQFFVDLGYCVFMPSCRRTPFNGYREIREDLSESLKMIVELMKIYGLQEKKIILGGMSSGGNLVALILYDRSRLSDLGFNQETFGGIMLFGAPLDLNAMKDSFVLRDFAGRRDQSSFQLANPVYHLQADEQIPSLCIHGTHDGLVPFSNAESFAEKLRSINGDILTFIPVENASHMDTASWAIENNEIRQMICNWLDQRER